MSLLALKPAAAMKSAYANAVTLWRDYSPKGRDIARKRMETDLRLDALARSTPVRFDGTVLVDGMWDNPNFWLRYSLLRGALGLAHGNEVGLVGQHRQRQCRDSFARLGISDVRAFYDIPVPPETSRLAHELTAGVRDAADVLSWKLPHDVHPSILYDGVLKRQRLATLDIRHPDFKSHVIECLAAIARAGAVLDEVRPDLLVVTHPVNFSWGALSSVALSRGIPVVLIFGLFGVLRFVRFTKPDDLLRFYDRLDHVEMDSMNDDRAAAMADIGQRYLASRLEGRADDLASVYAFQRRPGTIDRVSLCEKFGWDPSRPIVGFYASNWFDWPHQLGMTQFRDFKDWTEASFAAACANANVNWLFKPHPAEEWFGGVTLAEMLGSFGRPQHVAIADKQWNNAHVLNAIDALVTYHGTAGIEFAALGKPVLVPDRGKYDDSGFVRVAHSRANYLDLLGREWWTGIDRTAAKRRAEIFAGCFFCAPDWQGDFILPDDSQQDRLYDSIAQRLDRNGTPVARELSELAAWWQSGKMYYHTFKMMRASGFQLSNVGG